MASVAASANPEYRQAQRVYGKAISAVDHAIDHLLSDCSMANTTDEYIRERAALDAIDILKTAARRLNAEYLATGKRLGVGVYKPYGGRR